MFNYVLTQGDDGEGVRMVQKALNEALQSDTPLKTDGQFGPKMTKALSEFQTANNLPVTGTYGEQENTILGPVIDTRFLMDSDIDELSTQEELPGVVLKAIRHVEGKSDGFYPDGRPIILFERHKFYHYLGLKIGATELAKVYAAHPDICNPAAGGYSGGEAEYDRLEKAVNISSDEGYMSASYGMFQLMGFNYAIAGYENVNDLVSAVAESEKNQFSAIVNFIKGTPNLHKAVLAQDPVGIARNYNGSNYGINKYDVKIRDAIDSYN